MSKRRLMGVAAVLSMALALTGRKITLAQRPDSSPLSIEAPPTIPNDVAQVKRWRSAADPPMKNAKAAPDNPSPDPMIEPARGADAVVGDDPMGAVDSFLRRNRKETDDSIKALEREAETLRARLQKVEAALGRWQAVANALNKDASPRQAEPPRTELDPDPAPVDGPVLAPGHKATGRPAEPPEPLPGPSLPAEPAPPLPAAESASSDFPPRQ